MGLDGQTLSLIGNLIGGILVSVFLYKKYPLKKTESAAEPIDNCKKKIYLTKDDLPPIPIMSKKTGGCMQVSEEGHSKFEILQKNFNKLMKTTVTKERCEDKQKILAGEIKEHINGQFKDQQKAVEGQIDRILKVIRE